MNITKGCLVWGAVGILAACTHETDVPQSGMSTERIELNASMVGVQSRSAGVVLPGQVVTDVVFVRSDGDTPDWITASTSLLTEITASESGGKVLFNPVQFYPAENGKVSMVAYHPATGGTLANGIVTYSDDSMTGQQDLMYAPVVSGSKDAKITAPVNFSHKLAQLRFKLVQGVGFPDDLPVTSISVEGTAKPLTLNVTDGTLTFAAATSGLTVFDNGNYQPVTAGTEVVECLLVQPGVSFTLTVTLQDGTSLAGIPVTAFTTEASHSHLVTLTFVQGAISVTAEIAEWVDGTETDGKVQ